MERGDRNVVRLRGVDHALDARLRVGSVGERHSGLGEAERPARRQRHAPGESNEFGGDVHESRPEDEIEIEVAVLGLVASIAAEIIVVLAAEIEHALGAVVVEEPVRDAAWPVAHDQERPVLVKGIAALGVEAERVSHRASQPPPGEVERAGLVAEAVAAVAGRAGHRVPEGVRFLTEEIGLRLAVACEACSIGQRPVHAEGRERDGERERAGRERDLCRRSHDLGRDGRPRAVVQPVAAGPLRISLAVRGRGPRAFLPDGSVAQQRDAHEVVLERDDPHRGAVAAIEQQAARVGCGQPGLEDRFHWDRAPCVRASTKVETVAITYGFADLRLFNGAPAGERCSALPFPEVWGRLPESPRRSSGSSPPPRKKRSCKPLASPTN